MFYFLALENCHVYLRKEKEFKAGQTYYSTGIRHSEGDFGEKILLAFTLESDKPVWRYVQGGEGRSSAGVMTTAEPAPPRPARPTRRLATEGRTRSATEVTVVE